MSWNAINSKLVKAAAAVAACVLGASALSGCGSSAASATEDNPQTLSVAISSINVPYSYVDKSNNVVGFEAEVFRAVDKEIPEYNFNLKTYDFPGVLAQLNSGKSDIAVATLDVTKERVNKFGHTASYVKAVQQLTVSTKNNTIKSVADLKDGTFFGETPAYPPAQLVEKYSKEHNANIKIEYGNLTPEQIVASVYEGKYDATSMDPVHLKGYNEQYGDKLKAVGPNLTEANIVSYTPNKNLPALPKIDAALKKLYENGTLKKLSEQYLGADYSQYVAADKLTASR